MCGIVGYVGGEQAAPIILEGLNRLEYRGYDSAGIAVNDLEAGLQVFKDAGKLSNLRSRLGDNLPSGTSGIGHTRWATHGKATELNAHPHTDNSGDIVVIHNGIVENYRELREHLRGEGRVFKSETDSEVIPHLIADAISRGLDLEAATLYSLRRLRGAAAMLIMRRQEPGKIIAARIANAGGVVIGYGDGAMHIASDLPAITEFTQRVVFLEDGEMATVTAGGARYINLDGAVLNKTPQSLPAGSFVAGKGLYEHFMAKEIAEQPDALLDTMRGVVQFDPPAVILDDLGLSDGDITALRRVVLIGMGTSSHAAMVGRTYMEQLAGLPAEFDNASEYRYRSPVLDGSTLVVALTQSGETVDTLAAMHEAKRQGARVVAVCNVPGSQATRAGDGVVYIRCGPEVAVASTKTLIGSMATLYLLACYLGEKRKHLSSEALHYSLDNLAHTHLLIGETLKTETRVKEIAARYHGSRDFLFLGRGLQYPIAMEGALKLKEVSYLHAEGYPAGEMKHGPIALIDQDMPVLALALQDEHYSKVLNSIEQVTARGGQVIAIATEGDEYIAEKAKEVVFVPAAPELLQPLISVIPLQLLAYHIALLRGLDVDQPRNLAKTVTVE